MILCSPQTWIQFPGRKHNDNLHTCSNQIVLLNMHYHRSASIEICKGIPNWNYRIVVPFPGSRENSVGSDPTGPELTRRNVYNLSVAKYLCTHTFVIDIHHILYLQILYIQLRTHTDTHIPCNVQCVAVSCLLPVNLCQRLVNERQLNSATSALSVFMKYFICTQVLSTGCCTLVWLEGNGADRKTLSVPHYNTQMWQSATVDIIICVCLSRALLFFFLWEWA